jgi:hypothetical protein
MSLDDPLTITVIGAVVIIAVVVCAVVIFGMRRQQERKLPKLKPTKERQLNFDSPLLPSSSSSSPFRVSKSVQATDAIQAKDELRILDLEREILGDAIRHLYEAHAAGKINETEREKLASNYKSRMMIIKNSMAKDETIVALHELESMQEDLMKLFSERFGELTGKVEELRTRIDIKPVKEVKIQTIKTQRPVMPDQLEKDETEEAPESKDTEKEEAQDRLKKPRKPPAEKQKTVAEQRIDAMRNQIDEVMNKLGQMEIES